MVGYIYIPVPTPEMLEFARDWQDGQRTKGIVRPYEILHNNESGWRKGAKRRVGLGVLKKVTVADRVYILAHGGALGSTHIGARRGAKKVYVKGLEKWRGGIPKRYAPDELATVLSQEGLVRQFVDLRVFACGSANKPPNTPADIVSFAQGLAEALRDLNYRHIQVTGYQGAVRPDYSTRRNPNLPDGRTRNIHKAVVIRGEIFPPSTHKVVF